MAPIITLEEHYISSNKNVSRAQFKGFPKQILTKLESLDDTRVSDMDKGDVTLQILSHGPLDVDSKTCREINDELAAATAKNPKRLAGFAILPMAEPEAAAEELERCIKEHKFLGALLDNHLHGRFYDDEFFWPVFKKAEELDMPIYLHPTFATDSMMDRYRGNYPDSTALALSAFGWGWHSETGLHILRLYAAGLFDRFPRLKIVIGHMGELIPFQLERIIGMSGRAFGEKKRGLREVWEDSIWVTTSGMFSLTPLRCLLASKGKKGLDKVLYSVDYPFSANETGKEFLEEVKKSGMFTKEEYDAFVGGNSEKLFKIKASG